MYGRIPMRDRALRRGTRAGAALPELPPPSRLIEMGADEEVARVKAELALLDEQRTEVDARIAELAPRPYGGPGGPGLPGPASGRGGGRGDYAVRTKLSKARTRDLNVCCIIGSLASS